MPQDSQARAQTFVEIATATEELRQRLLRVYDYLESSKADDLPDCVRRMKDDIRQGLRHLSFDSDVARPFGLRVAQYLTHLEQFRESPRKVTQVGTLDALRDRPLNSLHEYMKGGK